MQMYRHEVLQLPDIRDNVEWAEIHSNLSGELVGFIDITL
jgi:hypothetical protein